MSDEFAERRRATAWLQRPDGPIAAEHAEFEAGSGHPTLRAGRLHRLVSGVEERPREVSQEELDALGDPMATLCFQRHIFPMAVQDLLDQLPGAVDQPKVYLVSESGTIPQADAPHLRRDIRFALTYAVRGTEADLLISTGANSDPRTTFLQVAAWDDRNKVFNYYMRITPAWIWTGNSWDALAAASRGRGCFDSHVNGSVVMKELKQPWINWQSQSAAIQLPDNDPLRDNPLYRRVIGAENLETTVRAQINRWTAARLEKVTAGGIVQHPDHLLRQLFTTTTVNLTSTATQSVGIRPGDEPLRLPMGFWMNNDALLDDLGLEVEAPVPATTTALYAQSLATFGFRLEEKAGNFSRPGDTFFAFVVPEAALEDNAVVREMGERGLISPKFAACALMVDFPNPVFSADRARLMRYVPTTATAADSLGDRVAQQILAAAGTLPADSPEARFAAHWNLPDATWRDDFCERLTAYLKKVQERITTREGFDDYVRLAESRRRQFKAMKLHEFELTLPVTDIPATAATLRMNEDATVTAQT
ncbi:hypothetical protein [Streptomyces nigrescens]|uniref:Uncharacterized protein n=1 Tax=Streptomyces nigrescens TaxID=1920 RepID=A0ABY7JGT6_STRNI|nr:hypothetical protein [Streptomyces nigrescens]WAU09154.1 hypothetical protein STRNI_007927 [Streptomyces nigrescens]